MKLLTFYFMVLILLCTHISYSQSFSTLQGSWSIDPDATIDLMASKQRAQYDSLDSEIQSQINDQLQSQSFSFNTDSTFSISVTGQQPFGGTFQIESNKLILSYSQGSQTAQTIEQLNNSSLVLRLIDDPDSQALIHKIQLNKIND